MTKIGVFAVLLVVSLPASAAMYKCTDADGRVTYKDRPCEDQAQEVLKEKRYAGSGHSRTEYPGLAEHVSNDLRTLDENLSDVPGYQPITPLKGGEKVTGSSPLAQVYSKFIEALNRCDRTEMMKYVTRDLAKGFEESSATELRNACRAFQMLLPGDDFKNATELIEGDKGTIQWFSAETSHKGSTVSAFRSQQNENFIKEDGAWKYDNGETP